MKVQAWWTTQLPEENHYLPIDLVMFEKIIEQTYSLMVLNAQAVIPNMLNQAGFAHVCRQYLYMMWVEMYLDQWQNDGIPIPDWIQEGKAKWKNQALDLKVPAPIHAAVMELLTPQKFSSTIYYPFLFDADINFEAKRLEFKHPKIKKVAKSKADAQNPEHAPLVIEDEQPVPPQVLDNDGEPQNVLEEGYGRYNARFMVNWTASWELATTGATDARIEGVADPNYYPGFIPDVGKARNFPRTGHRTSKFMDKIGMSKLMKVQFNNLLHGVGLAQSEIVPFTHREVPAAKPIVWTKFMPDDDTNCGRNDPNAIIDAVDYDSTSCQFCTERRFTGYANIDACNIAKFTYPPPMGFQTALGNVDVVDNFIVQPHIYLPYRTGRSYWLEHVVNYVNLSTSASNIIVGNLHTDDAFA